VEAGGAVDAKKVKPVNPNMLPGVNAYSWWSATTAPTKKVDTAKETEEWLHRKDVHKRTKGGCHDLYTCVDSMFGKKHQSNLQLADEAWKEQHLRQARIAAEQSARMGTRTEKAGSDTLVSTSQVAAHPGAPLLGVLDGDSHQHDAKLPGVEENRWGGKGFWTRLLGAPKKGVKKATLQH